MRIDPRVLCIPLWAVIDVQVFESCAISLLKPCCGFILWDGAVRNSGAKSAASKYTFSRGSGQGTVSQVVAIHRSWPTIGELRGKIMFVADPGYIADYNVAFPNLTHAVMFTSDGAFLRRIVGCK